MSKQVIYGLVAVVIVGGGFLMYSKTKNPSSESIKSPMMEDGATVQGEESQQNSGKKMSFSEFVKNGESYVCSVNQNVQNIESKGTVYISRGNISGDFKTSVSGMNMETFFIVKDGYSYTWSSMMPNIGYKVAVNQNSSVNTGASASGSYSFNAEQIGDYDCKPWTPSDSKFSIPSSVKFTEIKK